MGLTSDAIKDRDIETQNNLDHLKGAYGSAMGIIPFVGAGISMHFGYPGWGDFLRGLARKNGVENTIVQHIERGEYEEAASVLEKNNSNNFSQEIDNQFSCNIRNSKPLTSGAAGLIPFLAKGPVITTNFDRVLELVFKAQGHSLEGNIFSASQPSHIWSLLREKASFLLRAVFSRLSSTNGTTDPRANSPGCCKQYFVSACIVPRL